MEFDLVELFQYIGLNGKTAGIVLVILFLFWLLFANDKRANKVRIKIVKLFAKATTTIHQDKERIAEKIGKDIDVVLQELLLKSNATNAIVVRFRNGSYDSMGSSILKFFASNEKTRGGYPQIGDQLKDMSRTMYGNFCDTLIVDKHLKITKEQAEKDPEQQRLFEFLSHPEKLYAHSLVTTKTGQIIGFVCLIYAEPEHTNDKDIEIMLSKAAERIVSKAEFGIDD